MKQVVLHTEHAALGAKFVDFAGWSMPISYSSLKEEIRAVRESAGVFDVSHMGEFFITGPQACEFIDYLLPCDFQVQNGKAVYSPLLNNEGKIIDDLIAYKLGDEKVLICVNASNEEKDWKWINSVFESKKFDCELERKSDDFSLLALQGPKSEEILSEFLTEVDFQNLDYYGVCEFEDYIIARTGYTGEDGFEVFCTHENALKLWKFLMSKDVSACGLGARDTLRMEVCYPLYGQELSDKITPLDANLKWTLKSKVAYIGQEAIDATKPRLKLVKLSLEKGIPRLGYKVLNQNDEIVGEITSGTMSPTLGYGIGMALVDREKAPVGTDYKIEIRNKIYQATYHKKAFYEGGHK